MATLRAPIRNSGENHIRMFRRADPGFGGNSSSRPASLRVPHPPPPPPPLEGDPDCGEGGAEIPLGELFSEARRVNFRVPEDVFVKAYSPIAFISVEVPVVSSINCRERFTGTVAVSQTSRIPPSRGEDTSIFHVLGRRSSCKSFHSLAFSGAYSECRKWARRASLVRAIVSHRLSNPSVDSASTPKIRLFSAMPVSAAGSGILT